MTKLTQQNINNLQEKGFMIIKTDYNEVWIEKSSKLRRVNWKYLYNLLEKNNIEYTNDYWRGEGNKGRSKEIWINLNNFENGVEFNITSYLN
jgi:hypothetical protein